MRNRCDIVNRRDGRKLWPQIACRDSPRILSTDKDEEHGVPQESGDNARELQYIFVSAAFASL